ncbi:hypothetical protein EDD22DRAFT_1049684 [Suillus occidentalis]|nr:hypothetical protein EDD22DRAFT_1049684 [Suillus occidentalis]
MINTSLQRCVIDHPTHGPNPGPTSNKESTYYVYVVTAWRYGPLPPSCNVDLAVVQFSSPSRLGIIHRPHFPILLISKSWSIRPEGARPYARRSSHASIELSQEIRASFELDRTPDHRELIGELDMCWNELCDHGKHSICPSVPFAVFNLPSH